MTFSDVTSWFSQADPLSQSVTVKEKGGGGGESKQKKSPEIITMYEDIISEIPCVASGDPLDYNYGKSRS